MAGNFATKLKRLFSFSNDIGIDLGTSSVLINVNGRGIVLNEPAVVAVERDTQRLYAAGNEALSMMGRTPGNIVAIKPMHDGAISDYSRTEMMLKQYIKKVTRNKLIKPRVMVSVPAGVTEVEERAVIDATTQAGARQVYLIEEPIAAAIGAGMDISKPSGQMVVDIGGGTTDIAVISLNGIVVSSSIKVAGDKFDEAIVKMVRKTFNTAIGERTAEEIKMKIGSVYDDSKLRTMIVRGRSLVTGLPESITVGSIEVRDALEEVVDQIIDAVENIIERTPPELVGDISENGIMLTGGGAMISGLEKLMTERTGIHTTLAKNPMFCVARGTGIPLSKLDLITTRTNKYDWEEATEEMIV